MNRPLSIIGGGVAGCVLAHALARRGIESSIFERNERTRFSGGALLLWSNAMRALAEVGLDAGPRRFGQELTHIDFCSSSGERLWRLRADRLARKNRAPCILVPRAELLAYLDAQVAPRIEHRVFCDLQQSQDDVTARFEDGSSVTSPLLFGADGLRSLVRDKLSLGEFRLRETGQAIWVGTAPFRHARLEAGSAFASVGRGLRFWAAALPGERVYWYAIFPDKLAPGSAAELARHFSCFHQPVAALLEATPPEAIAKTSICDRHPAPVWGKGRVSLLGDAIHPVTPDLGQGACQAIESAVTAAELLADQGLSASALRSYERYRRGRTSRIANMSYFTAVGSMLSSPLACRVRDTGIAWLLPLIAAPELAWVTRGRHAC